MTDRLLDSVIIIDHLNGIDQATEFISNLDPSRTAVSVITRAEILAGLDVNSQAMAKTLLDQYQTFVIDKAVADIAANLRRQYRWKLPDAFQAALSQHHGTRLVTRNTKDFNPERYDFVEVPYTR